MFALMTPTYVTSGQQLRGQTTLLLQTTLRFMDAHTARVNEQARRAEALAAFDAIYGIWADRDDLDETWLDNLRGRTSNRYAQLHETE